MKKIFFYLFIFFHAVLTIQPVVYAQTKKTGFSSIQTKALTLADGTKWYYKVFDDQGRPSFAVLYDAHKEKETTLWYYADSSIFPSEQIVKTETETRKTAYTATGKVRSIAVYNKENTLISKTDNTYDRSDNLITQTIRQGTVTEKSVWKFVNDKAVTETKYYNGKKTAFIELGEDKRIVRIYKDGKEVLVTEEE